MRRALTLALVLTAAFLPAGCFQGDDPAGSGKGRRLIGVSLLTMNNPFFKEIADTITREAAKRGFQVLAVDGREDVARQHNQVKDFIVKRCSAVVLCPCDSKGIGPAILEANNAGVPVFTADIACQAPAVEVVTHVATDNYEGGRQAARGMIEALRGEGGKVVILDYKSVESCLQRVKGFKEVIEEHNRTRPDRIEIVAELPGEGAKDKGQAATADALTRHRDLAGIFAINDPSALGARAALERAGRTGQVKLIGFDGQPEGKQAIRDGKIYADPIQFPDRIGVKTVEMIVRYFEARAGPREVLIPTELYRRRDALMELK
jgi:ribose transport system substrate-binding protein